MSENTAESALAQDLNSFRIQGPNGLDIDIPDKVDLSVAPYFSLDESAAICKYYQHNGYVVIRNLIPIELCDRVRHTYEKEIKPYDGYLYRQPSSGAAEKHTFSKYGYLLNSILNLQNLNQKLFPVFRKTILEVITYAHLYDAAQAILGEPGVIVQSMYFEGNPATWAHQDTYYLDSTRINW